MNGARIEEKHCPTQRECNNRFLQEIVDPTSKEEDGKTNRCKGHNQQRRLNGYHSPVSPSCEIGERRKFPSNSTHHVLFHLAFHPAPCHFPCQRITIYRLFINPLKYSLSTSTFQGPCCRLKQEGYCPQKFQLRHLLSKLSKVLCAS